MSLRLRICNASKAPIICRIAPCGPISTFIEGNPHQNPMPTLSRESWHANGIHRDENQPPIFELHIGGPVLDARPVKVTNTGVSRMLRPGDRDGAVFCLTGSEYYWNINYLPGLDDRVSCWIQQEANGAG